MTRVLVCGGRWYDDQHRVDTVLDRLHAEHGFMTLIQGGQRYWSAAKQRFIGADYQASLWARSRGVVCIEEPARWRAEGQAAGPRRNSRMLRRYRPDLGVAFPGQNGTEDMVTKLRAAGVPVIEVPRYDG